MRHLARVNARRGATLVEAAVVLPVTLFLIFALIVGALGILRYQEVAVLAREASRYASTHGAHSRKDAGLSIGTATDWQADVYANAIQPRMINIEPSLLTVQVSWSEVSNQPGQPDNWPGAAVTVTLSYQWLPQLYLVGPYSLNSTSSVTISN